MVVFYSSRCAEHTPPPGHPERPERAEVFAAIAGRFEAGGGTIVTPRPATREELLRVHAPELVDDLLSRGGRASMIDPDTYTSTSTIDVALLAAGAAIEAARYARDAAEPALALVRPPGHHAEPGRSMGFCLFNNVAIAAAALRADGVQRVAIVDIDVHHGNGTQAAFYADGAVFYASAHQFPFYPGTGSAEERGTGAGLNATLNVPLAAGTDDGGFIETYTTVIEPALGRFGPDVLLVSAGFDAHWQDPLGGLRVSTDGYRRVVECLDRASARYCGRRAAWVTEGGYDLHALGECLEATVGVLS